MGLKRHRNSERYLHTNTTHSQPHNYTQPPRNRHLFLSPFVNTIFLCMFDSMWKYVSNVICTLA